MELVRIMNNTLKKFLQMIKLTAETVTAVLPFIKMIMVAAGALVLALLISANGFDKKEQTYLAEMRIFKEQAKLASQYADSLAVEVIRYESTARVAENKAAAAQREVELSKARTASLTEGLDSLKDAITDSTEMARLIIPVQDSIIQEQKITIEQQDSTITNLRVALVAKDTTISLLTISRDSLQRVVNLIPPPPTQNKLFGLQLPSRKMVFLIGTVTGVVVASKLAQ
jgi:hypothetical protein